MIFEGPGSYLIVFLEYIIVSRLTGHSLISSIYEGVYTSQNGGDMATTWQRGVPDPRIHTCVCVCGGGHK